MINYSAEYENYQPFLKYGMDTVFNNDLQSKKIQKQSNYQYRFLAGFIWFFIILFFILMSWFFVSTLFYRIKDKAKDNKKVYEIINSFKEKYKP